jgi:PHD/YefM family antitoxin component YafN of YafNO toxin-antitoxin module
MNSHPPTPLDISHLPDLVWIVEQVEATKRPLALTKDNKTVAVLTPVEANKKQPKNQQAIEETLALAGSWKALDFDDMLEQLDRIRHESKPTPPLTLDL